MREVNEGPRYGEPPEGGYSDEDYAVLLREELDRFVKELRDLGARKVLLFGSMAEGRVDAFTDIDLIAVMESKLPFVERCVWIYGRLVPRVAADILVYTPAEFEEMKEGSAFVRHALSKGVTLYEETAC